MNDQAIPFRLGTKYVDQETGLGYFGYGEKRGKSGRLQVLLYRQDGKFCYRSKITTVSLLNFQSRKLVDEWYLMVGLEHQLNLYY